MSCATLTAFFIGVVLGAIAVVIAIAIVFALDYKEMEDWFKNENKGEVSERHTSD
jgi:type IV secretory pathway component VirB8